MSLASGTVLLRPFQRNDIDRQREYFKDPELPWLDSNSPRGYAEIDLEELMDTDAAKERHVVALGIEVDGQYVGFCRLLHTANPNGVFEIGINIGDRRYWNKGVGKVVTRMLLAHGFNDLGANEIELTTNSKNQRALRCFEACGFAEKNRPKRIPYESEWAELIEMSIDCATWRALAPYPANTTVSTF